MLTILSAFLKPVLGFAFGTKGKAKFTIIILSLISVAIVTWYLMDKYSDMKVLVAEQNVALNNYAESNKQLALYLAKAEQEKENIKKDFTEAIQRRITLEESLNHVKQEKENALSVFEKECGRLDRLMQKKASLVVRFANRTTDELFKQFQEATRDNADSN
jgi:hypothetical protein